MGDQARPAWIAIEDFNRDNQSDIIVSNYNSNNVGVFLGFGNGTFSTIIIYPTGDGSGPVCLSIGDFNNDKILDIVVTHYLANNVVVLFGFGDGTFFLGKTYSTGQNSGPVFVAIGDLNNDTRLDIAVANGGSSTTSVDSY